MDYKSTLDGLDVFWNTSVGCSERQVRAWAMLYPFVKVRGSCKLLIVLSQMPCSLSVNDEACHIDGLQEYYGRP